MVGHGADPDPRDRGDGVAAGGDSPRRHSGQLGRQAQDLVQAVAIGLFVLPLSGPFLVAASVVMGAAIVLTVVTGIDYVASTVREVRRTGLI